MSRGLDFGRVLGCSMLIDASGSAWVEYKRSGTMHGMKMPEGLVESQKLPEPVFTPSTKAELGGARREYPSGQG